MTWATLDERVLLLLPEQVSAMGLSNAVTALRHALEDDHRRASWAWQLRRHLAAVREELEGDHIRSLDGWLTARASSTDRTRLALLARVTHLLGHHGLEHDREPARGHARRLLGDLEHYQQRLHDLVYDSVELEIGGSE